MIPPPLNVTFSPPIRNIDFGKHFGHHFGSLWSLLAPSWFIFAPFWLRLARLGLSAFGIGLCHQAYVDDHVGIPLNTPGLPERLQVNVNGFIET